MVLDKIIIYKYERLWRCGDRFQHSIRRFRGREWPSRIRKKTERSGPRYGNDGFLLCLKASRSRCAALSYFTFFSLAAGRTVHSISLAFWNNSFSAFWTCNGRVRWRPVGERVCFLYSGGIGCFLMCEGIAKAKDWILKNSTELEG